MQATSISDVDKTPREIIAVIAALHFPNVDVSTETPEGSIKAPGLLLASHSYTDAFASDLMPDLAREVVPVLSWQMATEPLSESQRAAIIPARQAVSDTHGDLYFMRYDARHQRVTGGALVIPYRGHERLRGRIGERLMRIFPQLPSVRFTAVWNGYIGMTSDYAPRIHRLGPNGYGWVGCNGHMRSQFGEILVRLTALRQPGETCPARQKVRLEAVLEVAAQNQRVWNRFLRRRSGHEHAPLQGANMTGCANHQIIVVIVWFIVLTVAANSGNQSGGVVRCQTR
jgi:hypothetical protein